MTVTPVSDTDIHRWKALIARAFGVPLWTIDPQAWEEHRLRPARIAYRQRQLARRRRARR